MQAQFHRTNYLTGIVSIAEALVADLGREFLVRYPGNLNNKTMPLDDLAEYGSIGAAVESLASKTINDWAYGRFPKLVTKIVTLYDKDAQIKQDLLDDLAEIKSTRDLFVHSDGSINKIYLSKAGNKARKAGVAGKLDVDESYLKHAEDRISLLASELEKAIPAQFMSMGRVSTFRAMWDATTLATYVPFDTGWRTEEDDDIVYPNEDGLSWAWASSQKMLLDFFLGIYSEKYPTREYDVMSAMRRWPATTNEGKVIMSWFDAPFWF
jgi:hypothetical protein